VNVKVLYTQDTIVYNVMKCNHPNTLVASRLTKSPQIMTLHVQFWPSNLSGNVINKWYCGFCRLQIDDADGNSTKTAQL